ncbi:class I adenylate-forming enzyme family protein [Marinactinospora thermotolerans]|uniref:class I adenylate-forming enzyme family protein n=1 Tax=Marinactinospora thermotolerans TaxID=531310 RepID=UPI003D8A02FD
MPIIEEILGHARSQPGRPAFEIDGETVGFAELADSALGFAHRLNALSVGTRALLPGRPPQGVVALSLRNSTSFVRAFVGATASTCATAVLDPSWPSRRTAAVLATLGPDVLVTDSADVAGLAEARRCRVVVTAGVEAPGTDRLDVWTSRTDAASASRVLADRDDDQILLIGFTSGTTSAPKAFARTRRSWRGSLPASARLLRAGPGETTLAPGPLAHGLSLYGLAESLYSGGTLVSARRFRARDCVSGVTDRGATRFLGVPTMLRALAVAADSPGALEGLRTLVSSGAKLDRSVMASLARVAPRALLVEYYGASELNFVSTATTDLSAPLPDLHDFASYVGEPFPGVEVSVRSPDGAELGEGERGTVFVRSDIVSEGYLGPGDGTGFRRDGAWCTVGDQGYLRGGALHIIGREGEMLISGGHNVYPAEVEGALREARPLSEVQVLGLPDPHLGTRLVAVLRRSEAGHLAEEELRRHVERHLPRHKVPREFYSVDQWPLTSSGKISKRTLTEWIEAGRDDRVQRIP